MTTRMMLATARMCEGQVYADTWNRLCALQAVRNRLDTLAQVLLRRAARPWLAVSWRACFRGGGCE